MQIYETQYLPASLRGESQGFFFPALSLFLEKHKSLNLKKGNSFRIPCKKRFTAPPYFSIIDIFKVSRLPHFSQRESAHFSSETGERCMAFSTERAHFLGEHSLFTICQDAAMWNVTRLRPLCNRREIRPCLSWGGCRRGRCRLGSCRPSPR